LAEVQALIEELTDLLKSDKKMLGVIKTEIETLPSALATTQTPK
jgi:DNA gyrase/topoisomerase IV subunit A